MICGMYRVKNEEKWLAKSLEVSYKICDMIVILDDGSTDSTPEICKEFTKYNILKYIRKDGELNEAQDKTELLKEVLALKPEWILAMDADEILENKAIKEIKLTIEEKKFKVLCWLHYYFWNSLSTYVVHRTYAKIYSERMFYVPGQNLNGYQFKGQGVAGFHCGWVPKIVKGERRKMKSIIKHYGYLTKEERERKYDFYCELHPERDYSHIIAGDEDIKLAEYKE